MKKLLLSLGVVLTSLTASAQFINNGNFEATMTQIGAGTFQYVYQTAGWSGFNFGPETTSPFEGAQAAKLVTTVDPNLNGALGWGNDTITGAIQQAYKQTIANPQDLVVAFAFKYTKAGLDTGYVEFAVWDTLTAGPTDDVPLYAAAIEIGASVASWTPQNLTMQATGQTGNANRLTVTAVSSTRGFYDNNVPTQGSTLWIDGIQVGFASISENAASEGVSVYPNPANNVLNIKSSEEVASVVVTTTDGKVVANSDSKVVSLDNLNAGMYIYQVTSVSGKVSTGKFMKN